MTEKKTAGPDNTAIRVALWRALHLQIDSPPYILNDDIGLQLAGPDPGWRNRPDMDPERTRSFRASIVARARFIEDLVVEESRRGVSQYVILGAGLDTFAERRPDLGSRLHVFEVDQPDTQAWKRERLEALGYRRPEWLHFVPVNFEREGAWLESLGSAGFDAGKSAVFASTGVSMYITKDATEATMRQIASLAPGSTLAMTFLLPVDRLDAEARPGLEASQKGARAAGTPFISFYTPEEMLALARKSGFKDVRHVSSADHAKRYFSGRSDGLRPGTGEDLLVAKT